MNSSITYNDISSLLLIGNLGMSYAEMKETICYEHRQDYNNIDVEITLKYLIGKHQYYPVSIVYNESFKTMINSFT